MEKENNLPYNVVEDICAFVKSKLQPYEIMWVNYHRILITGMNGRTTSIGEQMHHSMKSGFDKVIAGMSPEKSADNMMNKAQRRGQKQARRNVQKCAKTATKNASKTCNDLTTWCEDRLQEQLEFSKKHRVTQVTKDKFYVFCPDNTDENHSVLPRFYRCREVNIIDNKYASCSCGLSVRMKYSS